jgi:hypothetical protein
MSGLCRMFQYLEPQFLKCLDSMDGSVWTRLSWMISYAKPWLICKQIATSSIVTCPFVTVTVQTCSMTSSEVDVLGRPKLALSFTVVRQLLNFSVHSYIFLRGNILSLYCAEGLPWISAPEKPSDYN